MYSFCAHQCCLIKPPLKKGRNYSAAQRWSLSHHCGLTLPELASFWSSSIMLCQVLQTTAGLCPPPAPLSLSRLSITLPSLITLQCQNDRPGILVRCKTPFMQIQHTRADEVRKRPVLNAVCIALHI